MRRGKEKDKDDRVSSVSARHCRRASSCCLFLPTHDRTVPQPTRRQCLSMRRLRAIFSPISVHAGDVRKILAKSARTLMTRPPVEVDPMLTISTSFFASFWTYCVWERSRHMSVSHIVTTAHDSTFQSKHQPWSASCRQTRHPAVAAEGSS